MHTLAVGRFTTPSAVLMDKILAMPSFLGYKAVIRPSFHRNGGKFSSFSTTHGAYAKVLRSRRSPFVSLLELMEIVGLPPLPEMLLRS